MTARASRFAILPITLLGFALRVVGVLSQSLWRDEVDALLFATRPLGQFVEMFRQPGQNGPLFFIALRPWLAAAGHSEFALRFPSVLAGALSIPLLYVLVARLAGRRVALVAALLMATAPYGVWYGQEAKMYCAADRPRAGDAPGNHADRAGHHSSISRPWPGSRSIS